LGAGNCVVGADKLAQQKKGGAWSIQEGVECGVKNKKEYQFY
jgi:hypothetical protein